MLTTKTAHRKRLKEYATWLYALQQLAWRAGQSVSTTSASLMALMFHLNNTDPFNAENPGVARLLNPIVMMIDGHSNYIAPGFVFERTNQGHPVRDAKFTVTAALSACSANYDSYYELLVRLYPLAITGNAMTDRLTMDAMIHIVRKNPIEADTLDYLMATDASVRETIHSQLQASSKMGVALRRATEAAIQVMPASEYRDHLCEYLAREQEQNTDLSPSFGLCS